MDKIEKIQKREHPLYYWKNVAKVADFFIKNVEFGPKTHSFLPNFHQSQRIHSN